MSGPLPFKLHRVLGRGGMGVVFAASHASSSLPLAVKLLNTGDDRATRSFEAEAAIHARLDHPHVVGLFDFGRLQQAIGDLPEGSPYLVMEGASDTLRAVSKRREMTWSRVQVVVEVVCDALSYLHARNVIHRDLKPSNLLLGCSRLGVPTPFREGMRLADFGVSWREGAIPKVSGYTPSYAAPEQKTRRSWAEGPWTDTYALARVVERLVSGQDGTGSFAVPAELKCWLQHALDPHWMHRFESAPQMLEAFRSLGPPTSRPAILPVDSVPTQLFQDGPTLVPQLENEGAGWGGSEAVTVDVLPPIPPRWEIVPLGRPLPTIPGVGSGLSSMRSVPLQGFEVERGVLWDALLHVRDTHAPQRIGVDGDPERCAELLQGFAHRVRATGTILVFECGAAGRAWLQAVERALFPLRAPRGSILKAVDERLEPFEAMPRWMSDELARAIENQEELSAEAVATLLEGCSQRAPVVVLGQEGSGALGRLNDELQGPILVVVDGAPGITLESLPTTDASAAVTATQLPDEPDTRRWLARLFVRQPDDIPPALEVLPSSLLQTGWIALRHGEATLMRRADLVGKLSEAEIREAHGFWIEESGPNETLSRAYHLAGSGDRSGAFEALRQQVFPLLHAGRPDALGSVTDMLESLAQTSDQRWWARGARTMVDRTHRFEPTVLDMPSSHPLFPWILETAATHHRTTDPTASVRFCDAAETAAREHEDTEAWHEAMATRVVIERGGRTAEEDSRAQSHLDRYLPLLRKPTAGAARLWLHRGNIYSHYGNHAAKQAAFQRSRWIAEQSGNYTRIAMSSQALADASQDPTVQEWLLSRALHCARIAGASFAIGLVSWRYGMTLLKQKRFAEAEALFHRSIPEVPAGGWIGLAMAWAEQKRWSLVAHARQRLLEVPGTVGPHGALLLSAVEPTTAQQLGEIVTTRVQASFRHLALLLVERVTEVNGPEAGAAFERAHVHRI